MLQVSRPLSLANSRILMYLGQQVSMCQIKAARSLPVNKVLGPETMLWTQSQMGTSWTTVKPSASKLPLTKEEGHWCNCETTLRQWRLWKIPSTPHWYWEKDCNKVRTARKRQEQYTRAGPGEPHRTDVGWQDLPRGSKVTIVEMTMGLWEGCGFLGMLDPDRHLSDGHNWHMWDLDF